ncbi:MAG: hypothetical protein FJ125_04330, partial [Deltaproteobacteria bacterium]|nr:hypothetical protein [Deltaproteobacteria bacterium]
ADGATLQCRTPAHAEGPVEVVAQQGGQERRLADAFTYVPELSLRGVTPPSGPAAGGTAVTVRGSGFRPGAVVTVGILPLVGVQVVNDTTILGTTPPGSAGPALVTVRQHGRQAELPGGFTYTDSLRLISVEPRRGSVAGGTLLKLTGTGFVPGSSVLIGASPGEAVQVLDGSTLRLRTLPGVEGAVDVTVVKPDGTSRTISNGFEYFDPTTLFGGVWGGPVLGSINISVRNAMAMDTPVPGAFTMLWADRSTSYQGLTDEQGMITFSGPDLHGEQMITVAKEAFENTSVVRFDAENVTIALVPKPDPQPGPMPPGIPAARISGVVWGIDKYIPRPDDPSSIKAVFITTTQEDILTDYRPPPGEGGVLFHDGPYAIDARLGDLAVIAIAGIWNQLTQRFTPLRMGVRRFVYGISGEEVSGVDIQVNILLDQTASLRFDGPVRDEVRGPNTMIFKPYIDFESEGVFGFTITADDPAPSVGYAGDVVDELELPRLPVLGGNLEGLTFTFDTSLFTRVPGQDGLYVPVAVNFTTGVTDLDQPLDITPFVGVPRLSSPDPETGVLRGDRIAWELEGGSALPNGQLILIRQPSFPMDIPIWSLFVDGATREIQLPNLQDVNGFPPDVVLNLFVIPIVKDGFNFDQFEYGDYATLLWRSYSVDGAAFIY